MVNASENSAEQQSQRKEEQDFWQKIKNFATVAGREVVEKALILFYAAQRPETPLWAKTIIYSALAYLVLPTDAIPDFIPFTGYADDLATLATALGAVAMSITPQVKAAAKQQVNDWFGEPQPAQDSQTHANDDPIRVIAID
ncbi:MAG TPA: YkvA family protein [Coleofasciculaceae cyanobacterium]